MAKPFVAWHDANCNGSVSLLDVGVLLPTISIFGPVTAATALYDVWGGGGLADGAVSLADVGKMLESVGATQIESINWRDKYLWPFAGTSIWNMPLARGNEANFVAAGFTVVDHVGADENIIINTPTASPTIDVWTNNVGWDSGTYGQNNLWQYRMRTDAGVAAAAASPALSVPWPNNFILQGGDFQGDSPNWCTAIVNAATTGIIQFQPPTHGATTGSPPKAYPPVQPCNVITVKDIKADTVDLKADDTLSTVKSAYGSHGGSGMSALGGCIRIGELTPANTNGYIRHALKLEANSELYYSNASGAGGGAGYRWPATQADDCHATCYGGSVTQTQAGSLVALKTSFVVKSLKTEPAKIIARTLMRHGAYLVDSTSSGTSSVYHFCTERGPAGRVAAPIDANQTGVSNEFEAVWANQQSGGGHGFGTDNMWPEWQADMATIIKALFVVDNNASTAIGGPTIAGTQPSLRMAPPAPAFSN